MDILPKREGLKKVSTSVVRRPPEENQQPLLMESII